MESGVISHENISNILRNISQRRRQGILEVSYADQQEHIVFVQGRVVEAFSTNMFAIGELVLCLRRAGLIGEQENFDASTYGELLAELNQVGRSVVMDKPFLCRVNKHRILDHLYNLQMDRSAYYTFKVQMVEYDRDFAASISVGQVLLDLVALEGEHGQFVKDFPDHATIRSTTTAGTVELTEEERVVVEIASQDISCGKLRRKALLSRFHFESTLMSLHERGILSVSVTSPAHADTGTVPAALDTNAFLSALEVSIDSTFDQERNDSLREVARSSADPLEVSFGAADETQPLIEAAEHSAAPRWYVVQNTRLLQVNWMSPLLALVVLLTAISAPFLFWNDLLMSFTD